MSGTTAARYPEAKAAIERLPHYVAGYAGGLLFAFNVIVAAHKAAQTSAERNVLYEASQKIWAEIEAQPGALLACLDKRTGVGT